MRAIYGAFALLLIGPVLCGQNTTGTQAVSTEPITGYCPKTHALELAPQATYWLEGSIGAIPVSMFLDRGGSGVVGLFYAKGGDWTPTYLGGEWGAAEIDLLGQTGNHSPLGRLKGQLTKDAFVGSWTPADSTRVEPVRLAVVPEPACDGKGPWKRFDDPKWPVTFSYPASWRVEKDDDALRLMCPDPRSMAYGDEVTIYQGTGEPGEPQELMHCAKAWKYGSSCDCGNENSPGCRIPAVTRQQSKTILNLDNHEWRVYCSDDGYVGQGDGKDRMVLLRNGWGEFIGAGAAADIVERLVSGTTARAASKP